MKIQSKLGMLAAAFALGATPAIAIAAHPGGKPTSPGNSAGHSHGSSAPGPNASGPAKAKAYGKFCQSESKKHVAGQQGTPFSQCVTALAKLATGKAKSPGQACKGLSKKHVSGMKGTPFSQCVVAAAHLLGSHNGGSSTTTSSSTSTSTSTSESTSTTQTSSSTSS
jgi:hypothetical protein